MHRAPLRADIQALRGYAVVLVIAYHAGLGLAPNGFLGVDIFFVVSGYLIGGGVLRSLADGSFGFGAFYLRRIRRLVPAAYAVLLATLLAASALLTASSLERFVPQFMGALFYSTNIVLWQQINYFNTSAATEPLLHMWSLAIEEQFYLLLPLALWILPQRFRTPGIIAVTAVSTAAYLWLYPRSPGAAFYLLPTRAWELGLGVLAAIGAGRIKQAGRALRWPALAVLIGIPLVPLANVPLHWLAVPACLATAALLLGPVREGAWLWPLVRTGDASYSLYLVHWPLFAFANTLWLGRPLPASVALGLVALTALLGAALYRWVEQPGRYAAISTRRTVQGYVAATAALAALALTIGATRSTGELDLRGVTGLDVAGCSADAVSFDGRCTSVPDPAVLVWGDSFSQQMVPALLDSGAPGLAQASKGQCAPLLGLAPVDRDATLPFARGCLAFNRSVIDYLAHSEGIRVVVLSGYVERYAQPQTRSLHADQSVATASVNEVAAAQLRTVAAIRALGKRVVVVSGPSQASFDVGQCWERQLARLPSVAPVPNCAIDAASAAPNAAWSRQFQEAIQDEVPLIRFGQLLCPNPVRCETQIRGTPLYRDPIHFSLAGARIAGREVGLFQRVMAEAR